MIHHSTQECNHTHTETYLLFAKKPTQPCTESQWVMVIILLLTKRDFCRSNWSFATPGAQMKTALRGVWADKEETLQISEYPSQLLHTVPLKGWWPFQVCLSHASGQFYSYENLCAILLWEQVGDIQTRSLLQKAAGFLLTDFMTSTKKKN